ncbi:MAG: sensor histidine kinase [Polyangiales bacterium]
MSDDDTGAEAARAEYVRTGFLERIAHELRGPAGVALGALDELELSLEPGQIEKLRSLFMMARRGVGRVLRTADKLHRAGQLAGARVEWTKTPHDVREIVREASHDANELEARKGIALAVVLPEAPHLAIVDDDWLTTAVGELVINAIRHASELVSVGISEDEQAVYITVTDDGRGFVGPTVARFEEPSERRGLGLSIPLARDVAKAHGGELKVMPRAAEAHGAQVVLRLLKAGQAPS